MFVLDCAVRDRYVFDRVNLYQFRAPSFRFFLAKGWESTDLKEQHQAVNDLGDQAGVCRNDTPGLLV